MLTMPATPTSQAGRGRRRFAPLRQAANWRSPSRAGKPVIVEDGLALTDCESVDVIVESTGLSEVGARHAYQALSNHKHVVMVNVEGGCDSRAVFAAHG